MVAIKQARSETDRRQHQTTLPMTVAVLTTLIYFIGLAAVAVCDLWAERIPNALNLLVLAGALAWTAAHVPAATWVEHLAIGGIFGVGGLVLFMLGWLGGGDTKLLPALGLTVGPGQAVAFLLLTAIAGGGLTLLLLAVRRSAAVRTCVRRTLGDQPAALRRRGTIPYGVAMVATAAYLTWASGSV